MPQLAILKTPFGNGDFAEGLVVLSGREMHEVATGRQVGGQRGLKAAAEKFALIPGYTGSQFSRPQRNGRSARLIAVLIGRHQAPGKLGLGMLLAAGQDKVYGKGADPAAASPFTVKPLSVSPSSASGMLRTSAGWRVPAGTE